ncbi:MAG: LPS export ABC transporter periplasmic protein LptC [Proteobacteria bacterium]|nr:LPS export ABC transporter periplasmic protein LptC [Pseudomonadota bacterium]MBI3498499.1 LPS export ABC transporter periplasmic protein LptC [Pseudomonadota bacterium]
MTDASPNLVDTVAPPTRRRAAIRLPFGRHFAALSPHSSRLVALLKLVLPVVALTLLGLIVLWPQLRDDPRQFRLGTARIDPGEAEVLRMVNPRYVGLDGENQPFALTADSATQVAGNVDVMQLVQPKADLTMRDGSWVALSAPAGTYDRVRQSLHLSGGVSVFQDAGYAFFSPTADIDLIIGAASGDDPVQGQGPFGDLTASGFRILDKGRRVLLTGKSHLVLKGEGSVPAEARPAPKTSGKERSSPPTTKGASG